MIAVISDIHGNYPALKAVIEDIKKSGCDSIISLGDVAGYYCFINECISLCREVGVVNILGNHDYYLTRGIRCPRSYSVNLCLEYQTKVITTENLKWLQSSLPFLDLEDQSVSLRHGGWIDPLDEYIYDFSFAMVRDRSERIYASGHTHKQLLRSEDSKIYFNPGSVGQPRDHDARAAYAIITDDYDVILKRVEYPIKDTILAMRKAGFQDRYSECLLNGTKIGEIVK